MAEFTHNSIQIIALREYSDKKTGKSKLKHKLITTCESIPYLFENISSIVESIPATERWNIYYTALRCENPKENGRKLRRFTEQHIIPFDVDGLDLSRIEDYINVFFELTGLDRERTGIVHSGNGLQFIVQLHEPFNYTGYFDEYRQHYKHICKEFNARLATLELPGDLDPSVWSPARILRCPETKNVKKKKGTKEAKMIQSRIVPQDFNWAKISKFVEVEDTHQDKGWNENSQIKIDTEEIYSKCNFFKWTKESPAEVREPHFYAAVSILARTEGGHKRISSLATAIGESGSDSSVGGYTSTDIERKIEMSLDSSGPRTCKGIDTLWNGCGSCPMRGKVTSPISIKSEGFITTSEQGFHRKSKSGRMVPQYEDLMNYYDKLHKYVTMQGTKIVYTYHDTHYKMTTNSELEAFAYKHFRPRPDVKVATEFRKLMSLRNTVPRSFFEEGTDGYLNCKNCIVDLKTGEMSPHSHTLGFRYALNYDYNPMATAPKFRKFVKDIMSDDQELANILQEFGGYAMAGGSYKYHKVLVLCGDGRNGKGTFMDMLGELVGKENYSPVPLSEMNNVNNRQLTEGKLYNFCDEVESKDFKRIGMIKNMSGGGDVLVKLMYNQPYYIKARAKLIFACNEEPELSETSTAVRQRFILIPFKKSYTKQQGNLNVNLREELKGELPGILNYFIEGYQRLRKQDGFSESVQSEKSLEQYMTQSNQIISFLEDHENDIKVNPLNGRCTFASSRDLYKLFIDWQLAGGFRTWSITKFVVDFKKAIPMGRDRYVRIKKDRGFHDITVHIPTPE